MLLGSSAGLWAQNSSTSPSAAPSDPSSAPAGSAPAKSQDSSPPSSPQSQSPSSTPSPKPDEFPFPGDVKGSAPAPSRAPSLAPPRSDAVDAGALPDGESSSKDDQIDLSPPANDDKAHPKSGDALTDMDAASGNSDVSEFHLWDPHKAAKDVEVGDFYFKRKNYKAALERYKEALYYKDGDAIATFKLAVCQEKLGDKAEAKKYFEQYLKVLPDGPLAKDAHASLDRLAKAQ